MPRLSVSNDVHFRIPLRGVAVPASNGDNMRSYDVSAFILFSVRSQSASGHFTASVRSLDAQGQWVSFDDATVQQCSVGTAAERSGEIRSRQLFVLALRRS